MNKAHKELLKKNYDDACEAYVGEMLAAFEIDRENCFWVADEVGGVFMVGDMLSLNMQEIVYIVENDIAYDDCVDWQEYCLFANEYNQNVPNLKAWHNGCPRLSKDAQKHLISLKERFDKAIKDYKDNTTINY